MSESEAGNCLDRRRAGVLLHITSLPGPAANGDLGHEAFHFVDFLCDAGISVWQVLPVGPTYDGSPYSSSSVHAGNPQLISLDPLVEAGWLDGGVAEEGSLTDKKKGQALQVAWNRFFQCAHEEAQAEFSRFCSDQGFWLDDYALFQALHEKYRLGWWDWPAELRLRDPAALAEARKQLEVQIDFQCFKQFLFYRQWFALKHYANERGVKLFGDMPIFTAHDSAEVWAHQDMFHMDSEGHPTVVAGVPPDYFSELGQRWGNPLYCWDRMEEEGFSFWIERMRTQLSLFDLVRVDHFRGFESYWEIPATEPNAIHGRWVKAPGDALFERLHQAYDPLPIVAEDLGIITPEVEELRKCHGIPGMKILQFAFSGGPENPYLPFHYPANAVVYTGTHDNDTTLGWYLSLDETIRSYVDDFLDQPGKSMPWPLIHCAIASHARLAMLPMQDILGLDSRHRMNLPGTTEGNWSWRFRWEQAPPDLAARLRTQIEMHGRSG